LKDRLTEQEICDEAEGVGDERRHERPDDMAHAAPPSVSVNIGDEKAIGEDEERNGDAGGDPSGKRELVAAHEQEGRAREDSREGRQSDPDAGSYPEFLTQAAHAILLPLR
jgi:hypothetical protein